MNAPTVDDLIAAQRRAEQAARELHDAGRCGESEFSCSHCEAVTA